VATTGDWQNVLTARWRATKCGPFFEVAEPPAEFVQALPDDYLAAVIEFGGREGFLGETYLRLYRRQELVALNLAYDVPALLPKVIIFGSDGCGEAFGFLVGEAAVCQVPFLPLAAQHLQRQGTTFTEFIRTLAASGESPPCNPEAIGMELHDKHPICLGGSPTDPANKVLVPPGKHAELCRFWNNVHRAALARQPGNV
jgi:hypothetical protein